MATSGYVPRAEGVDAPWDLAVVGATAVALAGTLWASAGLAGGVLGLGLAVAWVLVPTAYVVAVGHVVLLAVIPEDPTVAVLALVEAGFFTVVVADVAFDGRRSGGGAVLARSGAVLALLGVTAVAALWTGSLLLAAIALSTTAAVLVYGLHRYELVTLGLVEA